MTRLTTYRYNKMSRATHTVFNITTFVQLKGNYLIIELNSSIVYKTIHLTLLHTHSPQWQMWDIPNQSSEWQNTNRFVAVASSGLFPLCLLTSFILDLCLYRVEKENVTSIEYRWWVPSSMVSGCSFFPGALSHRSFFPQILNLHQIQSVSLDRKIASVDLIKVKLSVLLWSTHYTDFLSKCPRQRASILAHAIWHWVLNIFAKTNCEDNMNFEVSNGKSIPAFLT